MPNASVTVTNTETNLTRSTETNNAGLYSFPDLTPGMYSIRVVVAGFDTIIKSNIQLQVQQAARVDFTLAVGQSIQTVEVSASAALLTTDNATVGTVINEARIREMPLNGRNVSLVGASPNVTTQFYSRRAGRRPPRRFARQCYHRLGRRPLHLGELHPGRHHQHRHRFQ
jgi:hypothetical protein